MKHFPKFMYYQIDVKPGFAAVLIHSDEEEKKQSAEKKLFNSPAEFGVETHPGIGGPASESEKSEGSSEPKLEELSVAQLKEMLVAKGADAKELNGKKKAELVEMLKGAA